MALRIKLDIDLSISRLLKEIEEAGKELPNKSEGHVSMLIGRVPTDPNMVDVIVFFNATDSNPDMDLMPEKCDCGTTLNEENNHSAGECNICHEVNKDD